MSMLTVVTGVAIWCVVSLLVSPLLGMTLAHRARPREQAQILGRASATRGAHGDDRHAA